MVRGGIWASRVTRLSVLERVRMAQALPQHHDRQRPSSLGAQEHRATEGQPGHALCRKLFVPPCATLSQTIETVSKRVVNFARPAEPLTRKPVIYMSTKIDRSVIVRFYRGRQARLKRRLPDLEDHTFSNEPLGIGDTLVLTSLPRRAREFGRSVSIYSFSPHFHALVQFNPYYTPGTKSKWVFACDLVGQFDLGPGHVLQRLERACGLSPHPVPRGCLVTSNIQPHAGRCALHFEPGQWAQRQRDLHPRAREVYPVHMVAMQEFIRRHPEMHFVEVGSTFSRLVGVEDWTGIPLTDTIARLATSEYFIGINSGPMHIAAALGLKTVTIINFPDPTRLYLPALKDLHLPDLEWLYPQSVILHEDGEGELVKEFSLRNLERAIAGELYPYWSTQYLDLLFDKI
jgi:hypothetical protein